MRHHYQHTWKKLEAQLPGLGRGACQKPALVGPPPAWGGSSPMATHEN